jgi:hypothetical protein
MNPKHHEFFPQTLSFCHVFLSVCTGYVPLYVPPVPSGEKREPARGGVREVEQRGMKRGADVMTDSDMPAGRAGLEWSGTIWRPLAMSLYDSR